MARLYPALCALGLVLVLAAACGGGGGESNPSAPLTQVGGTISAEKTATTSPELDADPSLPGEYIDIPALYGGPYSNDAKHVTLEVDYSAQGLPPVGGPHWGNGACPPDPVDAPKFCGPVQWGIYRAPWPPASVVHNMEHGGVVIWYNTTNQQVVSELEQHIADLLLDERLLVMLPYPDLPVETIALTSWTRRDEFPVSEYSLDRVDTFINAHERRFNPERL